MDSGETLQAGKAASAPAQGQEQPSSRMLVGHDEVCVQQLSIGVLTASGYELLLTRKEVLLAAGHQHETSRYFADR
jgi:hypothetical protein